MPSVQIVGSGAPAFQVPNFEVSGYFQVKGVQDEVVHVYIEIDHGFLFHTGTFWQQLTETKFKRLNANVTIGSSETASLGSCFAVTETLPATVTLTVFSSLGTAQGFRTLLAASMFPPPGY